jgi:hypothetical protein
MTLAIIICQALGRGGSSGGGGGGCGGGGSGGDGGGAVVGVGCKVSRAHLLAYLEGEGVAVQQTKRNNQNLGRNNKAASTKPRQTGRSKKAKSGGAHF